MIQTKKKCVVGDLAAYAWFSKQRCVVSNFISHAIGIFLPLIQKRSRLILYERDTETVRGDFDTGGAFVLVCFVYLSFY